MISELRAAGNVIVAALLGAAFVSAGVVTMAQRPWTLLPALVVAAVLAWAILYRRVDKWAGFRAPGGTTYSLRSPELRGDFPAGLPVAVPGSERHVLRGAIQGRRVTCFEWVRPGGRRDWLIAVPLERTPGEFAAEPGIADLTQCAPPLATGRAAPKATLTTVVRDGCLVTTLPNPSPARALAVLRDHGDALLERARQEEARLRALPGPDAASLPAAPATFEAYPGAPRP